MWNMLQTLIGAKKLASVMMKINEKLGGKD